MVYHKPRLQDLTWSFKKLDACF